MENKINLSAYVNPYVKHFQVAQLNLIKYMEEEERIFKRISQTKRRLLKKP